MLVSHTFPQAHAHVFLTAVSLGSYLRGAKRPSISTLRECVPEEDMQPRANTSYMREMTEEMIITHGRLTLLEHIGQGACTYKLLGKLSHVMIQWYTLSM